VKAVIDLITVIKGIKSAFGFFNGSSTFLAIGASRDSSESDPSSLDRWAELVRNSSSARDS
jgi:hypothetical protein